MKHLNFNKLIGLMAVLLVSTLLFSACGDDEENLPVLNFTTLNETIKEATDLIANTTEGTEPGNQVAGSKATLQIAIDVAKASRPGAQAQSTVDDANTALLAAITTFKNAVIVSPAALDAEIAKATALLASTTEGTTPGNQVVGSKATLEAAIDVAVGVKASATLQSQLDEAKTTLSTAITNFNASIVGGVPPVNGLQFSLGGYITIPGYSGIIGAAARTQEAWIKTEFDETSAAILSWGVNGGKLKWDMRLNGGALRIEYNGGFRTGTEKINDNMWHHVAVVVPDSVGDIPPTLDEVLLYVDGEFDPIADFTQGTEPINTSDGTEVVIGSAYSAPDAKYFIGNISDVRIWSVARTGTEIKDNYNKRLAGIEAGLEAYWKLDEGEGDSVLDATGNGRGGKFVTAGVDGIAPVWVELEGESFPISE